MSKSGNALASAARIAAATYLVALVVLPLIGALVNALHLHPAGRDPLLPPALAVVAIGAYIASLVVERSMLRASAERAIASGPAVALMTTPFFGLGIALFGLLLAVLGAGRWPLFFYALCFIHGAHLLARGQRFSRPTGVR
jgi:alpha-beta hydrolase superfamily lysophospholipase